MAIRDHPQMPLAALAVRGGGVASDNHPQKPAVDLAVANLRGAHPPPPCPTYTPPMIWSLLREQHPSRRVIALEHQHREDS